MPFAEGTTVAVEKTRAEIEGLLRKAGATEFSSGYTPAVTKARMPAACASAPERTSSIRSFGTIPLQRTLGSSSARRRISS